MEAGCGLEGVKQDEHSRTDVDGPAAEQHATFQAQLASYHGWPEGALKGMGGPDRSMRNGSAIRTRLKLKAYMALYNGRNQCSGHLVPGVAEMPWEARTG